MAGLFDTTNDPAAAVMQRRQQANQALGSPYGKYAGIVQAGGMFADTGADAIAGGGYGSADPTMAKSIELKKIAAVVAQQFPGKTDTPDYYKALALAVNDKYPEKAKEAMAIATKKEQEAQQAKLTDLKIKEAEKNLKAGEAPMSTIGKLLEDRKKYQEGSFGYQALTSMIEKEYKTTAAKDPSVGARAELFAQTTYMKPFSELDQKQREDVLKKSTAKEGVSLGEGLEKLAAALAAKEISTETAKGVAAEVTPSIIQGHEDALNALKDAKALLGTEENPGIFTGGYSGAAMAVAKYSGGVLASQKKLANTELFRQRVNKTVIPLLQALGGPDSDQDVKMLQELQGSDVSQQWSTINAIIDKAIKNVENGIKRVQKSYNNIKEGKGGVDVSIKETAPAKQVKLSNGTVVTVRRKD